LLKNCETYHIIANSVKVLSTYIRGQHSK